MKFNGLKQRPQIFSQSVKYDTHDSSLPLWKAIISPFLTTTPPLCPPQCLIIWYEPVFGFSCFIKFLIFHAWIWSGTAAVMTDVVDQPAFSLTRSLSLSLVTDCCRGDSNENRCKSLSAYYYYWLYKKIIKFVFIVYKC